MANAVTSSFCVRMSAQLLRNFLIDCVLCTVDMAVSIPCVPSAVKPLVPFMAEIYIKSPTVDFKLEVEP